MMPVDPKLQFCAIWGDDSDPGGNQTLLRHTVVSKKRNFDPSARKAASRLGSITPGQKKNVGNGDTTNNHAVVVARILDPPATYAIILETVHVRSF
mmetsp:Transcript_12259/g.29510  ORF Transcript_12259/g.29510 Transcript_12259/m.29510 type:complete len:96 (-) Transcript_12259:521-808(-)